MDITRGPGIWCGYLFVVTISCYLISMRNCIKGEVEKAVIRGAANYLNASMASIQPGIWIGKKKKKQNGQYYTAWLSEAIFYSKLFLVLFLFRFIWVFLWKGLTMFYCCIFAYSALLMAWYKIREYVPELWIGFGPTTVEGIDWQRKPQLYF